jgi:hypothetical protein
MLKFDISIKTEKDICSWTSVIGAIYVSKTEKEIFLERRVCLQSWTQQ